ncbi:MAG: helix-turn-helix domain-containing protein [Chloroflexi bacterium]|nr:helix-turn-helix domain-containing protein [Chloroflexota bacterium]
MAMPKEWCTVDEAAEYLGVSRRTIYKLSKEGRLQAYILGKQRTRRFRKRDLDGVPRALDGPREGNLIEGSDALSVRTDPVLAELWDNEKDAVYDAL